MTITTKHINNYKKLFDIVEKKYPFLKKDALEAYITENKYYLKKSLIR